VKYWKQCLKSKQNGQGERLQTKHEKKNINTMFTSDSARAEVRHAFWYSEGSSVHNINIEKQYLPKM
jgi:hypothetical protein